MIQLVLSVAMLGMAVAQLVVLPVPGRPGAPPLGDPVPTARVAHRPATRDRQASDKAERLDPGADRPAGRRIGEAVVPVATVRRELVVPEDSDKGRLVGWQLIRRRSVRVDRDRGPRRYIRTAASGSSSGYGISKSGSGWF